MDNIHTENERDAGSRLKGYLLIFNHSLYISGTVNTAQLSFSEKFDILIVFGNTKGRDKACCRMQVQLAYLLLNCHLGHKYVNVLVHLTLMGAA